MCQYCEEDRPTIACDLTIVDSEGHEREELASILLSRILSGPKPYRIQSN